MMGDIQLDKSSLQDYSSTRNFTDAMSTAFTNHGTYKDGKMTKLNIPAGTARVAGTNPSTTTSNGAGAGKGGGGKGTTTADGLYKIASNGVQFATRKPTAEELKQVFEITNCPLCRVPRQVKGSSHWFDKCDVCGEFGYSIEYDFNKDIRRPAYAKHRKKIEEEQTKPSKALEAVLNGGVHPDVEKKNVDDSELKTEVTSNTTKSKNKKETIAGAGNRGSVVGLGRFSAIAPDDSSDASDSSSTDSNRETVFMPASTVVDKLSNSKSSDYLSRVISNSLRQFDYEDANGRKQICISTSQWSLLKLRARIATHRARRSKIPFDDLEMIPDSGATCHMFKSIEFFEGDYTKCIDVFVLMGDGTKIPVEGIGTARIKIDGHVSILPNTLHVPSLDANLFSTTKHACNGAGCSFLLEKGSMHLSFPTFSVSRNIPSDGDLRVSLQPLDSVDWHVADHTCDGIEFDNSVFKQIQFLNRIHFGRAMTRAQKKQKLQELKQTLGTDTDTDTVSTASLTDDEISDDDDDDNGRFIYEGKSTMISKKYLTG